MAHTGARHGSVASVRVTALRWTHTDPDIGASEPQMSRTDAPR